MERSSTPVPIPPMPEFDSGFKPRTERTRLARLVLHLLRGTLGEGMAKSEEAIKASRRITAGKRVIINDLGRITQSSNFPVGNLSKVADEIEVGERYTKSQVRLIKKLAVRGLRGFNVIPTAEARAIKVVPLERRLKAKAIPKPPKSLKRS